MSDGRKKRKESDFVGPGVVTLDQDEFNKVCKRVHSGLMEKVDKARALKEKRPSPRSSKNHIEASKEVFVFVHLLELVESMTEEISDLRSIITQVASDGVDEISPSPVRNALDIFSTNKKKFMN